MGRRKLGQMFPLPPLNEAVHLWCFISVGLLADLKPSLCILGISASTEIIFNDWIKHLRLGLSEAFRYNF